MCLAQLTDAYYPSCYTDVTAHYVFTTASLRKLEGVMQMQPLAPSGATVPERRQPQMTQEAYIQTEIRRAGWVRSHGWARLGRCALNTITQMFMFETKFDYTLCLDKQTKGRPLIGSSGWEEQ